MKARGLILVGLLSAIAIFASDPSLQLGSRYEGGAQLGPKGAAILFGGSQAQLTEISQHRETYHKLGAEVFARSGAHSGWIILDAKRVIVAKYGPRYTSAAILVHQFLWTPPNTREMESRQLVATIGASNSTVAPGERVALTLDIELGPNMHVYAPGVEGYIPIDWKMDESAAAEVHAPVFPRAEKLYLQAIDETVPAYRSHFRLIRDVTIAAGASGELNVAGSLRYQACDDRVCYIPQTMRLQWVFHSQP